MEKQKQRIFLRMYVEAYRSGLVAALGSPHWATLMAIACHMNKDGWCRVSQGTVAKLVGTKRETVNKHIQALCKFRWNGQPILLKEEQEVKANGYACSYRVLPASCLEIFGSTPQSQP